MEDLTQEIGALAAEFQTCQSALLALGDETRQHLLLELMQMRQPQGAAFDSLARMLLHAKRILAQLPKEVPAGQP